MDYPDAFAKSLRKVRRGHKVYRSQLEKEGRSDEKLWDALMAALGLAGQRARVLDWPGARAAIEEAESVEGRYAPDVPSKLGTLKRLAREATEDRVPGAGGLALRGTEIPPRPTGRS